MIRRPHFAVLLRLAQVALTVSLLWVLSQQLDLGRLVAAAREMGAPEVALVFALFGLQLIVVAFRMRVIANFLSLRIGFWQAFQSVLVGAFVGQTPLTSLGGDAARMVVLARSNLSLHDTAKAVALDRIFGLLGLLAINLAVVVPLWATVTTPALRLGVIGCIVAGLLCIVGFLTLGAMPAALRRFRLLNWVVETAQASLAMMGRPGAFSLVLGLSLVAHLINIVIFHSILVTMGQSISFWDALVLLPFPLLLSLLPLSIGGWGVREGAVVIALAFVGIATQAALSASVMYGIALLLVGLVGGVVWMFIGRPAARDGVPTSGSVHASS
jgi:glycosyltransferase 2 family protein